MNSMLKAKTELEAAVEKGEIHKLRNPDKPRPSDVCTLVAEGDKGFGALKEQLEIMGLTGDGDFAQLCTRLTNYSWPRPRGRLNLSCVNRVIKPGIANISYELKKIRNCLRHFAEIYDMEAGSWRASTHAEFRKGIRRFVDEDMPDVFECPDNQYLEYYACDFGGCLEMAIDYPKRIQPTLEQMYLRMGDKDHPGLLIEEGRSKTWFLALLARKALEEAGFGVKNELQEYSGKELVFEISKPGSVIRNCGINISPHLVIAAALSRDALDKSMKGVS